MKPLYSEFKNQFLPKIISEKSDMTYIHLIQSKNLRHTIRQSSRLTCIEQSRVSFSLDIILVSKSINFCTAFWNFRIFGLKTGFLKLSLLTPLSLYWRFRVASGIWLRFSLFPLENQEASQDKWYQMGDG